MLRSIREKEVRIDIEIKKALEQNNDLAEKGASEMQAVHRCTKEGEKQGKTMKTMEKHMNVTGKSHNSTCSREL